MGPMWTKTTFEWKGGLRNLPVTTFGRREDEPVLLIKELTVWIENNRDGHIRVILEELPGAKECGSAYEFVTTIFYRMGCGFVASGHDYTFSIRPVNGEHITVTVTKKLVEFLKKCGVTVLTAPRIVTESFEGHFSGQVRPSRSYGEMLFDEILRGPSEQ